MAAMAYVNELAVYVASAPIERDGRVAVKRGRPGEK